MQPFNVWMRNNKEKTIERIWAESSNEAESIYASIRDDADAMLIESCYADTAND